MFQSTIQLYRNAYSGLSKEVWLLSIISLINRAGAMVFPFLTIYLTYSLEFSLKEAGLIMSFFGLGSIVGSYAGGWLTDRIGDYKVQFWSLLLSSGVLLLMVQFQTFWAVALIAFTFSVVADAFRPANKVAVANYSKPENLTRSFALLRLAINLGFAVGPAMGGLLAAWKGYEWLFYMDALTCFSAAVLFKITMKDEFKEKAIQKKQEEKAGIIEAVNSPYQDTFFLAFLAIICLLAFAFLQLFYTVPVFYKEHLGLGEGQIGLLMALNGVIIVVVEMPLVYWAERQYSTFSSMAFGAGLIGLGFIVFAIPSIWVGIAALSIMLLTMGEIFYMPFASAFVAARASDSNRGQYMALYTMAWAVASVVAPMTGLYISETFGFRSLWMLLFLIGVIGMLGFWFLGKKQFEIRKVLE